MYMINNNINIPVILLLTNAPEAPALRPANGPTGGIGRNGSALTVLPPEVGLTNDDSISCLFSWRRNGYPRGKHSCEVEKSLAASILTDTFCRPRHSKFCMSHSALVVSNLST